MNKPRVICHMLTSVDGKVTGDFLSRADVADGVEEYYRINREFAADAYACGRVTMEGSFTGGAQPDLSAYAPCEGHPTGFAMDFSDEIDRRYFAVAFDRKGSLGWSGNLIEDADPGYGGAHIIEILTEEVDPRYYAYLEERKISYIVAGKYDIAVPFALYMLQYVFGVNTLLLEGGSVLDGAFQRSGMIDELSLVSVPVVGDKDDKPLFWDSVQESYRLTEARPLDSGALWLRYQKV